MSDIAYAISSKTVPADITLPAHTLELANNRVWQELLTYETSGFVFKKYTGQIIAPVFYLATAGKTDPQAELEATLDAFFTQPAQGQVPAQCRYPGRYLWLNKQLNLNSFGITLDNCTEYLTWRDSGAIQSISLMFVTGYLANPASYYGHNMLKLNNDSNSNADLSDTTISFGAAIPDDAGVISYLVNGIFGGYKGVFSHTEFFHYANNYGETELRDIWEYELALDAEELDLILAHLWELMQFDYNYYFFNKNCAYRIARLFSVLHDYDLSSGNRLWYTPQTLIQRMASQGESSGELFQAIRYHPSRQTRLYNRYRSLESAERKIVSQAVELPAVLYSPSFTTATTAEQHRSVDVLLDYYQFLGVSEQDPDSTMSHRYNNALSARYTLPPGSAKFNTLAADSPHTGRKISYISAGVFANSHLGQSTRLGFRPAYYDPLDYASHHSPTSALTMSDVELLVHRGKVKISKFTLFNVESNSARVTGLPGDTGRSWQLEVGARQDNLADPDSLRAHVSGAIGQAYTVGIADKDVVMGWRLGGSLQENYQHNGLGIARATLFVGSSLSPKLRIYLRVDHQDYLATSTDDRLLVNFTLRHQLTRNTDLRLFYNKNVASEAGLRLGFYW